MRRSTRPCSMSVAPSAISVGSSLTARPSSAGSVGPRWCELYLITMLGGIQKGCCGRSSPEALRTLQNRGVWSPAHNCAGRCLPCLGSVTLFPQRFLTQCAFGGRKNPTYYHPVHRSKKDSQQKLAFGSSNIRSASSRKNAKIPTVKYFGRRCTKGGYLRLPVFL